MQTEKSFEQLEQEFKPIILRNIKTLSLYQDLDVYYQIGLIALWKASISYDRKMGVKFSTYAFSLIRGNMLDHLKKEKRYKQHFIPLSNEHTNKLNEPNDMDHSILDLYGIGLTANQKKWMQGRIIEDKTYKQIAFEHGVSIDCVKSWGKQAIKKLKAGTKSVQLSYPNRERIKQRKENKQWLE